MTNNLPSIKIFVATHKAYAIPRDDIYTPIQVGRELAKTKLPQTIGDNTNDNISSKNPVFCELTALYWAWKNTDADYIGLVHYRRHFKNPYNKSTSRSYETKAKSAKTAQKLQQVASSQAIRKILQSTDAVLPKKRKYYIENLYNHYSKTMNPEPLLKVRAIIEHKCPEYLAEFDKLKQRRSAHMFNMLLMKKDILNSYCDWLFPILFELEKQVDSTNWSDFQKRYAGRISERLLDVWINTNNIKYAELPVISIETVNWLKKGIGFLKAKFLGRQYEKSW